jgi:hypothetical protein
LASLVGEFFKNEFSGNPGLILIHRSWSRTALKMLRSPDQAFWWVLSAVLTFLGVALYGPFLPNLFYFPGFTGTICQCVWTPAWPAFFGSKSSKLSMAV